MGGEATEVHDATVEHPAGVGVLLARRRSRARAAGSGLFSEASSRFEKGVDRSACVAALDRAAALMAELAGGEVAPGVVDAYPLPLEPRTLDAAHRAP